MTMMSQYLRLAPRRFHGRLSSHYYYPLTLHRESIICIRTFSNTPDSSPLVLFDSLSGSHKVVGSGRNTDGSSENKAWAWYTCGPTVYDAAHLGHARTYVTLDIFRRLLLQQHSQSRKAPPIFIMNITNVDDKILERAKELNVSALELASKYEIEFWQDMKALNVMKPTIITRVTDHVENAILPFIERLLVNKFAYISNSSVYFDVRSFEESSKQSLKYGKLAPPAQATEFFCNDDGVTTNRHDKRDARDFVLWKGRAKGGEELVWSSPWGLGRPGWHIECSAMIEYTMQHLLPNHDILVHAGGVDLKFPHHTNEIAQSEAYNICCNKQKLDDRSAGEWIPHWVHTGHLHIKGRKMSKSLKNFITIREMLGDEKESKEGLSSPTDDFRLWCLCLSGSYRDPTTYSDDIMRQSKAIRGQIVRFLLDAEHWINTNEKRLQGSWGEEELKLFDALQNFIVSSNRALFGSVEKGKSYEIDGSAYLKEIMELLDHGNAYLKIVSTGDRTDMANHPSEVMQQTLLTLRHQLRLVGFTDKTTNAGQDSDFEKGGSNIEGGEDTLIQEFVRFRSYIRKTAINGMKDTSRQTETLQSILKFCDEVRDNRLPSIGLQISDTNSSVCDKEAEPSWKYCIPKKDHDSKKVSSIKPAVSSDLSLSKEDWFRLNPIYEGMFTEFDSFGLPTINADGTPVSKRLMKKLIKKRDKAMQNMLLKKEQTEDKV